MKLDKFTILETEVIEQAIELIEYNNCRCIIVLNTLNKVTGVLSEGDILRAFLKGVNIKSQVKNIMNPSFKYLFEKDKDQMNSFFKKGITLIPILNQERELVDVLNVLDYL